MHVPKLVETHSWPVNLDHVLAIWLLSSKVKFKPWISESFFKLHYCRHIDFRHFPQCDAKIKNGVWMNKFQKEKLVPQKVKTETKAVIG